MPRSRSLFRSCMVVALTLGLPMAAAAQTGETIEYYGLDALGSVRIVFTPTGTVLGRMDYGPFGDELFASAGIPKDRFAGLFRDGESGLDYAKARAYQVRTGRFSTVDPVYAGLFDPQQWNRYSYAANSPLIYVDPDGTHIGDGVIRMRISARLPSTDDADGEVTASGGGGWFFRFFLNSVSSGQGRGDRGRGQVPRIPRPAPQSPTSPTPTTPDPIGSGDPIIDVIMVVGGLADGMLLGFGDEVRGAIWGDGDPVDVCSGAYAIGSELSMVVGSTRLAYASTAAALRTMARGDVRRGANAIAVATSAVFDRNTMKVLFRVGQFSSAGMVDAAKFVQARGATGAITAAGKTNGPLNALGAGSIYGGLQGVRASGGCGGQ